MEVHSFIKFFAHIVTECISDKTLMTVVIGGQEQMSVVSNLNLKFLLIC